MAELDGLARRLAAAQEEQLVVTHGEPHPGNLIMTGQWLRLIGWDTEALALPERDLWILDDGSAGSFRPCMEVTGRSVNGFGCPLLQAGLDAVGHPLLRAPGKSPDLPRGGDTLRRLLTGGREW